MLNSAERGIVAKEIGLDQRVGKRGAFMGTAEVLAVFTAEPVVVLRIPELAPARGGEAGGGTVTVGATTGGVVPGGGVGRTTRPA